MNNTTLRNHMANIDAAILKKDKECETLKLEADGKTVHVIINRATKQIMVMYGSSVKVLDYVLHKLDCAVQWLRKLLSDVFGKLSDVFAV